MTHEELDRWIAALVSGQYRQGQGYLKMVLKDHCEFCCLGVLCDLNDPTKWGPSRVMSDAQSWELQSCDTLPPMNFSEKAGLYGVTEYQVFRAGSPSDKTRTSVITAVTAMNDYGYSFARIATFLEANREVLCGPF